MLDGDGVSGVLTASAPSGCGHTDPRVGLWGDGFSTDGLVVAQPAEDPDGSIWVWFPLRTGAGEGQAAMRLQGQEALLPLGGRAGEFDLSLTRRPGTLDPHELDERQARADASLDRAREAWGAGAFLLRDPAVDAASDEASVEDGGADAPVGPGVVGELRLLEDEAARVAVFDSTWLTDGLVLSDRQDDGADIVLSFNVQPSLDGERGRLRVNVPLGLAVVPVDRQPTPDDRVLLLQPGALTEAQRGQRIASASGVADARERDWIVAMGRELAIRSTQGLAARGRCLRPSEVDPSWALLLRGYDVSVVSTQREHTPGEEPVCVVQVRPTRAQHRRRWRGRIGPQGELPTP